MLWWLAVDGGATRLIIHNGANPRCLEAIMPNSTSFRTNNSASLLNGIESGDNTYSDMIRVRRVGVFDFGTGRVGYLQKSSGTGTGRDG